MKWYHTSEYIPEGGRGALKDGPSGIVAEGTMFPCAEGGEQGSGVGGLEIGTIVDD